MADAFATTILQELQAKQLVNNDQLGQLYQQANNDPAVVLQMIEQNKIVPEENIAQARAAAFNLPYVDLSIVDVDADVLRVIPKETAEVYNVVPFKREGLDVSIALSNPTDVRALEAIDFLGKQENVHFVNHLASNFSVQHVLRQYDNLGEEVQEALAKADVGDIELGDSSSKTVAEEGEVKTAPVSKMISVILKHAIEGKCSDVHIEPVGDETRVRYRVDGILHTSLVIPGQTHSALVARIKVLANLKLDETRLPQDGRFKMKYEKRDVEFRVSTLPLMDSEKIVLRILDTSAAVKSLEELGFSGRNLERIRFNLRQPHGMVLITGPTGSGKSTTLYSMLVDLNKEGVNIITLEDPVEYNLAGIAQSQMRPEIGLTFAKGLRSVLRQDPDIIMVGEIRDNETAELATHAALTGHMMLSTLHTNDAFGAIPRMMDMHIEPFLVASALNIILAQRLVRRICDHCRAEVEVEKTQADEIAAEIAKMPTEYLPTDVSLLPPYTMYRGAGCARCDDTGYRGRTAINEVLENTPEMSDIIDGGKAGDRGMVEAELKRQGMFTMRQDGLLKVFRGETTLEEVWNVTKE